MVVHGGIVRDPQVFYKVQEETLIYDFATNRWVDSFPAVLENNETISLMMHTATMTSDDILVVYGGTSYLSQWDSYYYSGRVFTFDMKTRKWSEIVNEIVPNPRVLVPGVLIGDDIFYYGGYAYDSESYSMSSDVLAFNVASGTWREVQYQIGDRTSLAPQSAGAAGGNLNALCV